MYIMNPISDTESEPDQNAPIVESLEKTKPKRKGVAPKAEEPKQVPPPKPKRQLTERQLEALAKAREKRALARKEKSEKEVKIETPEPEPQPLEKVEPKEVVGGRNPPPVVEKKKRTYNKKAKAQPLEPKKEVKIETPEPEPQPLEKVEPKEVVGGRNPPPVVEKKKRTYNKKAPAPKAEVAKIDFV